MQKVEWWRKYQVDVPEGESGKWKVSRYEISKEEADFGNIRSMFSPVRTSLRPGTYTKLTYAGQIIMSDTFDEISDHLKFIRQAQGRILITGLGLGMVTLAVAAKDSVEHVTVIEKSVGVLNLVKEHTLAKPCAPKIEIIQADALEWKPPRGREWDWAWHDIWPEISAENNETMSKLHRKFGRRCMFQDSWRRDTVKRLVRQDKEDQRLRNLWKR